MGVAGFYKWLVQKYPLIRHRLNDISHPKINHFYIDFNCIIYNSIRLVKPSQNGDNTMLFNEVCRYLDLLVQTIHPETTLFIAVDGPAPIAKCTQQRSRRFLGSREHVPGTFSTANISVGTQFMEDLHNHLVKFLNQRVKDDASWARPKLIYSSYRTPGEGEHKFFSYIREQKERSDFVTKETHCIYSPDADLIFLSLQTGIENFYIMREWNGWMGPHENVGNGELDKLRVDRDDFEFLHIPILRDYFQNQYKEKNITRFITDFIAFSFLAGNDFIPHFPEIQINHGDLDNIIAAYTKIVAKHKKNIVNEDLTFNKECLKDMLLSLIETSAKKEKKPHPCLKLKGARNYLKSKYNERYNADFERELCHSVIDSFNWVLKYYFEGVPSWTWSFNYLYAPPLIVICQYLDDYESTFELGRPPYPLEQLVCIIPRTLSSLLPEPYANLMYEPSPIAHLYPDEIKVDLNGRKFEHEGVVLIPFIELDKVREEAAKANELLSEEQKARNTWLEPIVISEGNGTKIIEDNQFVPHLQGFDFKMNSQSIKLNVFNRPSFSPSFCIHPEFSQLEIGTLEECKNMIGERVLFDWPYNHLGVIIGVFDSEKVYISDNNTIIVKNQEKEVSNMQYFLRTTRGIDVKDSKIGAIISAICVDSYNETHCFTKVFRMHHRFYPMELVKKIDEENVRKYIKPFPAPPKEGELVVLQNGKKAIFKGIENGNAHVQLINENLLDTSFISDYSFEYDIEDIADHFDLPVNTMTAVLTSLPASKDEDIAFTVIHGKNILDGYVAFQNRKYMYSKELIPFIEEYMEKFHLLEILKRLRPDNKGRFHIKPSEKDIEDFPEPKEVMNWIKKESPIANKFLISSYINIVKKEATDELNEKLNEWEYSQEMGEEIEVPFSTVIFKDRLGASISTHNLIGKRVVAITSHGPVPFGTTGTVIGYNVFSDRAYVAADKPFDLGSTLRMRFDSQRGFVIDTNDIVLVDEE